MNEIPQHMHAVLLHGHGGPAMLEYRDDIPVPTPGAEEVLIRVGAAGVNNTDVNTRTGWYAKSVTGSTDEGGVDSAAEDSDSGGWSAGLTFPRIQGADAAGTIVAVGDDVDRARIGERVMVRTMQASRSAPDSETEVFGSEFDGGFAQFATTRASEAFRVDSDLSDIELASFPCAYSTAEGMIHKIGVNASDRVLITGASGGVGSAAIQLAKRRGAEVIAVASKAKWADLEPLGADQLLDRDTNLVEALGENGIDVVLDVVAGPNWPALLDVLRIGGRYMTAGAIAGPIVELDVRTLYLKDLTLMGSTMQPREVFENLVRYVEAGEITPMVSNTYPLSEIGRAQADFLAKLYPGKLVLIPPDIKGFDAFPASELAD